MVFLPILVFIFVSTNLVGADSTSVGPGQLDTLSSIRHRVSNMESEVLVIQDSLRMVYKITQETTWKDIGIPIITAIIGFISALLVYDLQKRHQKKQREDTWQALSSALCKEARDSVERCCYLVECQALNMVSRSPLPKAARQHLMDQLSAIAINSSVMVELTSIYNIIDRIAVHADTALDLEGKGDTEQALGAQGKAVAFIRLYLSDMIRHLQNLEVPIDEKLKRRQEFINQFKSSWPEFVTIAHVYSMTDDLIYLIEVLRNMEIDGIDRLLVEMVNKQYLRIERPSVFLTQHILENAKATTWSPKEV